MWKLVGLIALLVFLVVLLIVGPLLLIWSLNTLFGLAIVYTFKTWLAALLISGAAKTIVYQKN